MARAPGRAQHTSTRLDAGIEASGPHVFAVRISAVRQLAADRSREDPPCHHVSCLTLPRPPHPAPTFVTMANAPLSEQDGVRYRVICNFGKAEYFFSQGLTRRLQNSPTGKSVEPCADTMAVGRIGAEGVIRRSDYNNPSGELFWPTCRTRSFRARALHSQLAEATANPLSPVNADRGAAQTVWYSCARPGPSQVYGSADVTSNWNAITNASNAGESPLITRFTILTLIARWTAAPRRSTSPRMPGAAR
jgi:hypothetical protein